MQQQLVQQETVVRYGVVQYERGFEVVEVEGFLTELDDWLLIYGDPSERATSQRNTAILKRRVIEVDSQVIAESQAT